MQIIMTIIIIFNEFIISAFKGEYYVYRIISVNHNNQLITFKISTKFNLLIF